MGNLSCSAPESALLAAVARDFCPFPDYGPSPLYNILSANSSQPLSEHYAAVQASLTPQQQQDFTRTLRSTFGKEGKVSHGGLGVVALSLAVLFDTVARQVKGQYVSDQDPIQGLFLRNPTGTYAAPVHTVSKYLRLVPHIANNPTRMADETERYLEELKRASVLANAAVNAAGRMEDITVVNAMKCDMIGNQMLAHLQRTFNKTVDLNDIKRSNGTRQDPEYIVNLNCDPQVASERFMAELDSFDSRTKEAFESCKPNKGDKTVIENIAWIEGMFHMGVFKTPKEEAIIPQEDFDLKVNALAKWI